MKRAREHTNPKQILIEYKYFCTIYLVGEGQGWIIIIIFFQERGTERIHI